MLQLQSIELGCAEITTRHFLYDGWKGKISISHSHTYLVVLRVHAWHDQCSVLWRLLSRTQHVLQSGSQHKWSGFDDLVRASNQGLSKQIHACHTNSTSAGSLTTTQTHRAQFAGQLDVKADGAIHVQVVVEAVLVVDHC